MSDAAREAEAFFQTLAVDTGAANAYEEIGLVPPRITSVDSLAALLDRHAADQSAALVAVLREVEWAGPKDRNEARTSGKYNAFCPLCHGHRPRSRACPLGLVKAESCGYPDHGHADDCRIAAALHEPPQASENARELADEIAREQAEGRQEDLA